jgi:glutathione reductase (NADPH)
MEKTFDLVVIGTGDGGTSAALVCAKAGWKVATVDSRPYGGTCALRGSDVKKVLYGAAEAEDWMRRMKGKGIEGEVRVSWPDLMAFKKTFVESFPDYLEKEFGEAGIETLHGKAKFVSEDGVRVGADILKAEHILVAPGSIPVPLRMEGAEFVVDSEAFMEMEDLPKRIVFIGGGYVSFEFAHIASRAGSEVHIVEVAERPLKGLDEDMVDELVRLSEDMGMRILTGTEIIRIVKKGGEYLVTIRHEGKESDMEADLLVHGAGRVPDLEGLDLDAANVERDGPGIRVNEYLQSTSNPRVYAAGDAASHKRIMLAAQASVESHIAASNMMKGNHSVPDFRVLPRVLFTIPKIASVGLTEAEARQAGYEFETSVIDTTSWYTYRRTNERTASVKILVDKKEGTILGAHALSNEADELINQFALAMQFRLKTEDIKKTSFGYPSTASDMVYMI